MINPPKIATWSWHWILRYPLNGSLILPTKPPFLIDIPSDFPIVVLWFSVDIFLVILPAEIPPFPRGFHQECGCKCGESIATLGAFFIVAAAAFWIVPWFWDFWRKKSQRAVKFIGKRWENHGKTKGKSWENRGKFHYKLVFCKNHGTQWKLWDVYSWEHHRTKWWSFQQVMLNYQRVPHRLYMYNYVYIYIQLIIIYYYM